MVRLTLTVGGVVRDFQAEAKAAKDQGLYKGYTLVQAAQMLRDQALRQERAKTQEANGVTEGDYLFM